MQKITWDTNDIIKFILFLYITKIIICQKKTWNYDKCKKYLKGLGIFCIKINKNEIFSICEKWETKDPLDKEKIPKSCQNRNYILPLLIKNSNPPSKIDCVVNINSQNIIEPEKVITKNNEEIKNCIKTFGKFVELTSLNFNDTDDNNHPIIDLKIKLNISSFCVDFSLIIINELEKDLQSQTFNKKYKRSIKGKIDFIDYINICLFEYMENENDDKRYFDTKEGKRNNQNDYDNELEIYYKNSKKDCVEYGLNSLNKEYIICTKYE